MNAYGGDIVHGEKAEILIIMVMRLPSDNNNRKKNCSVQKNRCTIKDLLVKCVL